LQLVSTMLRVCATIKLYFVSAMEHQNSQAEVIIPVSDLTEEMNFFINLGFRLDNIFPSDDPAVAVMSGHGIQIRLDRNATPSVVNLHILTDNSEQFGNVKELKSPGGSIVKVLPKTYQLETPATQHKFEVRKLQDGAPWVIGRAGMLYRDLIPDRLGGSIIASHIRIPGGGPVPDMVHYHTVGFQLIYCYAGWVKVVYEDQGPPITLHAGDCVTQPPQIRHRVLESSDNCEVIEIGVPAEHMTTIDHEMELPTKDYNPHREFGDQTFCHHIKKEAEWTPWRLEGFEFRETGINQATKGVASVHVARKLEGHNPSKKTSHNSDILFTFVMKGGMELSAEGQSLQTLKIGDAYVIPPNLKHKISYCSDDLELLEVSLPGSFETTEY
jgi:quercetin dioxygenase-like cupin family protein